MPVSVDPQGPQEGRNSAPKITESAKNARKGTRASPRWGGGPAGFWAEIMQKPNVFEVNTWICTSKTLVFSRYFAAGVPPVIELVMITAASPARFGALLLLGSSVANG